LKNVPHDERVDLWSVGVIVYLLLSGYPPFAHESQKELFRKIRTGEFVFHREDWVNISDDAKTLVRGLLVVDPEQRWTADQALQCAWIQDPDVDLSQHDLKSSIQSLRERRTRLRKNKNSRPVVWRHDDPTPVAAKLKLVISAVSLHGMDTPEPA
jgi:calcium/calmodulin-dependent protein kinase I